MKVYTKQVIVLSLFFMLFVVIGTLSHELGHIAVARSFGYQTTLHYASMNSYKNPIQKKINEGLRNNKNIVSDITVNDMDLVNLRPKKHSNMITIGGPALTILTGIVGIVILRKRRKGKRPTKLKFVDWFAVFLALFWLREVFNLAMTLVMGYIRNKPDYFAGNGDEIKISQMLDFPNYLVPVVLGGIGFLLCVYVVFNHIPTKSRSSFILSGFIGGGLGYYLWMYQIGPMLLP